MCGYFVHHEQRYIHSTMATLLRKVTDNLSADVCRNEVAREVAKFLQI